MNKVTIKPSKEMAKWCPSTEKNVTLEMRDFKKAIFCLVHLRISETDDYWNCKDQHHLLETHVNYHKTINEIDSVMDLLEKYIEENE